VCAGLGVNCSHSPRARWRSICCIRPFAPAFEAAGHASTELGDTYFAAEGDVSLDASKLGHWTGLGLNDLAMAKATLSADKDALLELG
jgi:hypothetical protein